MTDATSSSFTKLVPGFDFLQDLVKNAGAALPGIGTWVAPTLDPAELDKRIGELRTVQFWLEQNARMIATTIQALEVQRMTLSTLKTMNVQMEDLRDSLQLRMPSSTPAPVAAPAAEPEPEPAAAATAAPAPAGEAPKPPGVDPLQWWGALTKQFTELATRAMKDTASDAARQMSGALMKQSLDSPSPDAAAPSAGPARAKKAAPKRAAAAKRAAPAREAKPPRR